MSRFTHESPMDFEFDNGTGPLDARSPFAQLSTNAQRFPGAMNGGAKKRTYSAFDSPSKSRVAGLQSSPTKPLPPTPAFNSLFTTPRKQREEVDDSSAGETPRSPEHKEDSPATPEVTNARSVVARFDEATMPAPPARRREGGSPTKERPHTQRRESLLGAVAQKMKNKFYSPGRGEMARTDHAGRIEKSINRKRKREVDRRVARQRRSSVSESEVDDDEHRISPRKSSGQRPANNDVSKPHWISNLFTFIAQHPTVPHILSFYAQLLFNVFLLCTCGYLIYCFWSAVQGDVDKKSFEEQANVMAEMAQCANHYQTNKCDQIPRSPYLEAPCDNWYRCMTQDPTKVGRAKVSAHTFAEIFNSFVEPISYKAMIFTSILVFGCFGISNLAFGIFRSKAQQYQPDYGYTGPPPPTPQRTFSGQDGGFYAGTPWHPPPGANFEPLPSGGYGQIEGRGSPARRLMYE